MRLIYTLAPLSLKDAIVALKAIIRHYDELLTERDNEIQLLRGELREIGHPSFKGKSS